MAFDRGPTVITDACANATRDTHTPMRFQRDTAPDEPEINLIPLIDVLLVLLIFLTATTTFARYSELPVNLPAASAEPVQAAETTVEVSADGRYAVDGQAVVTSEAGALASALRAATAGSESPLIVIHADAQASHQAVVDVMQAARDAGIARLSFAAKRPGTAVGTSQRGPATAGPSGS